MSSVRRVTAAAPACAAVLQDHQLRQHVTLTKRFCGYTEVLLLLLQVLLDVLGHEELSDFLALLVGQHAGRGSCNSKGYYSSAAATAAASRASRNGSGTLTASQLRGASSIGEWMAWVCGCCRQRVAVAACRAACGVRRFVQ
jgi:hypothetical protein